MFESLIPVSISPRAAEEIDKIMQSKGIPDDYGLRVGIRGGGCGATLIIGFDKRKEFDNEYFIKGIQVYIDKRHTLYVMGKEVDFYEGADTRGFFFKDEQKQE